MQKLGNFLGFKSKERSGVSAESKAKKNERELVSERERL